MNVYSVYTILELTIKGADREFRTGVLPIERPFVSSEFGCSR